MVLVESLSSPKVRCRTANPRAIDELDHATTITEPRINSNNNRIHSECESVGKDDINTHKNIREQEMPAPSSSLQFAPYPEVCSVWEKEHPLVKYLYHREPMTHILYSKRAHRYFTAASDGLVKMWKPDYHLLDRYHKPVIVHEKNLLHTRAEILSLSLSPLSVGTAEVLLVMCNDGTVTLIRTLNGEVLRTLLGIRASNLDNARAIYERHPFKRKTKWLPNNKNNTATIITTTTGENNSNTNNKNNNINAHKLADTGSNTVILNNYNNSSNNNINNNIECHLKCTHKENETLSLYRSSNAKKPEKGRGVSTKSYKERERELVRMSHVEARQLPYTIRAYHNDTVELFFGRSNKYFQGLNVVAPTYEHLIQPIYHTADLLFEYGTEAKNLRIKTADKTQVQRTKKCIKNAESELQYKVSHENWFATAFAITYHSYKGQLSSNVNYGNSISAQYKQVNQNMEMSSDILYKFQATLSHSPERFITTNECIDGVFLLLGFTDGLLQVYCLNEKWFSTSHLSSTRVDPPHAFYPVTSVYIRHDVISHASSQTKENEIIMIVISEPPPPPPLSQETTATNKMCIYNKEKEAKNGNHKLDETLTVNANHSANTSVDNTFHQLVFIGCRNNIISIRHFDRLHVPLLLLGHLTDSAISPGLRSSNLYESNTNNQERYEEEEYLEHKTFTFTHAREHNRTRSHVTYNNLGHSKPITCYAWSDALQLFVTGGRDYMLYFWSPQTSRPVRSIDCRASHTHVAATRNAGKSRERKEDAIGNKVKEIKNEYGSADLKSSKECKKETNHHHHHHNDNNNNNNNNRRDADITVECNDESQCNVQNELLQQHFVIYGYPINLSFVNRETTRKKKNKSNKQEHNDNTSEIGREVSNNQKADSNVSSNSKLSCIKGEVWLIMLDNRRTIRIYNPADGVCLCTLHNNNNYNNCNNAFPKSNIHSPTSHFGQEELTEPTSRLCESAENQNNKLNYNNNKNTFTNVKNNVTSTSLSLTQLYSDSKASNSIAEYSYKCNDDNQLSNNRNSKSNINAGNNSRSIIVDSTWSNNINESRFACNQQRQQEEQQQEEEQEQREYLKRQITQPQKRSNVLSAVCYDDEFDRLLLGGYCINVWNKTWQEQPSSTTNTFNIANLLHHNDSTHISVHDQEEQLTSYNEEFEREPESYKCNDQKFDEVEYTLPSLTPPLRKKQTERWIASVHAGSTNTTSSVLALPSLSHTHLVSKSNLELMNSNNATENDEDKATSRSNTIGYNNITSTNTLLDYNNNNNNNNNIVASSQNGGNISNTNYDNNTISNDKEDNEHSRWKSQDHTIFTEKIIETSTKTPQSFFSTETPSFDFLHAADEVTMNYIDNNNTTTTNINNNINNNNFNKQLSFNSFVHPCNNFVRYNNVYNTRRITSATKERQRRLGVGDVERFANNLIESLDVNVINNAKSIKGNVSALTLASKAEKSLSQRNENVNTNITESFHDQISRSGNITSNINNDSNNNNNVDTNNTYIGAAVVMHNAYLYRRRQEALEQILSNNNANDNLIKNITDSRRGKNYNEHSNKVLHSKNIKVNAAFRRSTLHKNYNVNVEKKDSNDTANGEEENTKEINSNNSNMNETENNNALARNNVTYLTNKPNTELLLQERLLRFTIHDKHNKQSNHHHHRRHHHHHRTQSNGENEKSKHSKRHKHAGLLRSKMKPHDVRRAIEAGLIRLASFTDFSDTGTSTVLFGREKELVKHNRYNNMPGTAISQSFVRNTLHRHPRRRQGRQQALHSSNIPQHERHHNQLTTSTKLAATSASNKVKEMSSFEAIGEGIKHSLSLNEVAEKRLSAPSPASASTLHDATCTKAAQNSNSNSSNNNSNNNDNNSSSDVNDDYDDSLSELDWYTRREMVAERRRQAEALWHPARVMRTLMNWNVQTSSYSENASSEEEEHELLSEGYEFEEEEQQEKEQLQSNELYEMQSLYTIKRQEKANNAKNKHTNEHRYVSEYNVTVPIFLPSVLSPINSNIAQQERHSDIHVNTTSETEMREIQECNDADNNHNQLVEQRLWEEEEELADLLNFKATDNAKVKRENTATQLAEYKMHRIKQQIATKHHNKFEINKDSESAKLTDSAILHQSAEEDKNLLQLQKSKRQLSASLCKTKSNNAVRTETFSELKERFGRKSDVSKMTRKECTKLRVHYQ